MDLLALGKTCLLDGGFRIGIVQLTFLHVTELKAALQVPASTQNFVRIMDGNLLYSSNYVTLPTKWMHR